MHDFSPEEIKSSPRRSRPFAPAGESKGKGSDSAEAMRQRMREVVGIVTLASAIFLFVCLFSYDALDSPFNTSNPRTEAYNYGGRLGAAISEILYFVLGIGAYALPLTLGTLGYIKFLDKRIERPKMRALGVGILVVAGGTLLALKHSVIIEDEVRTAGVMNVFLATLLSRYLGTAGAYLLSAVGLAVGVLLSTDFLFLPFLAEVKERAMERIRERDLLREFVASRNSKAARKTKKRRKISPPEPPTLPEDDEPKEDGLAEEMPKGHDISRPYEFPAVSLLAPEEKKVVEISEEEIIASSRIVEKTLRIFGIEAKVIRVERGPVVTMYEVQPAPGVKVNRIVSLEDDIAMALAARGINIIAPIPGKSAIGIEIPNQDSSIIYLEDIIGDPKFEEMRSPLPLALGADRTGRPYIADLVAMPHLLIAGSTGSGKSVCINSIILGIIYKSPPEDVKLILVDPKRVELSVYNDTPHLLVPVISDIKEASLALHWLIGEMEERYRLMVEVGARSIDRYNQIVSQARTARGRRRDAEEREPLPYIVVIVDELADLMMAAGNDIEDAVTRLAQMARAVGIHLVLATQRPSVDVITGLIKANFPARISFQVSSKVDSRTILDMNGAEKLLGRGDMLFLPPGASKPIRIQGSYVSEAEVERVIEYLKRQGPPKYMMDIFDVNATPTSAIAETDELYEAAVRMAIERGEVSTSMLQRRFRIGYARAGRLVDAMEMNGIISPQVGSKPREVLVERDYLEAMEAAKEE
ncbi:MAG: DNA translocase FtsK [bacterium]